MAISTSTLRAAASRTRHTHVAKSLIEAMKTKQQTAFLCHSHKDQELAKGLQTLLIENGWNVYIDWLDEEMPKAPGKETAEKIKLKISLTDWFLFLATDNSTNSRWCPWEIGYADSAKDHDNILMIPTVDYSGRWYGNEYLQLYRSITDASNELINKTGYAVFAPGSTQGGTWVENLF